MIRLGAPIRCNEQGLKRDALPDGLLLILEAAMARSHKEATNKGAGGASILSASLSLLGYFEKP